MSNITKIVLTGGPCAGKTTALVKVIEHFSSLGFKVFTIPEVPTMFTQAGMDYLTKNKAFFYEGEKATLEIQMSLEDKFFRMAEACTEPCLIVCDRGTMDISAYMKPSMWEDITRAVGTSTLELRGRYDAVLHLVSAADGAEFQRRAQLLVDYYSTFEVAPGEFADGKKTLPENIADLGGLEIAFQALTNKLKNDGVSGEELRQQQRNFFVAYANLWRNKFNDTYALMLVGSDVHSCSRERVNGVVANMDAWYDLFDVKPGNALYRSPEDRIHIW